MAYSRPRRSPRRGRRGFSSRPARRKVWVRSQYVTAAAVLANYGNTVWSDNDLDPGARLGSTVLRSVGSIEILGAGPWTSGGVFVGFAIYNVSEWLDPLTPPITPWEDRNSVDWMHWSYYSVSDPRTQVVKNDATGTTGSFTIPFDIKSRRIISQPQESLIFVVQNNSLQGTAGANLVSSSLVLLG